MLITYIEIHASPHPRLMLIEFIDSCLSLSVGEKEKLIKLKEKKKQKCNGAWANGRLLFLSIEKSTNQRNKGKKKNENYA